MNKNILFLLLCLSLFLSCKEDGAGDDSGTSDYVVIGTLSGLESGNIVLQNNAKDNLSVSSNGTFAFLTQMKVDESYEVTILNTPEHHTCNVTKGTGVVSAIHIIKVKVTCTYNPLLTIGVQVSGLNNGTVVLQNNGGDNLSINTNGNYVFPFVVSTGDHYSVTTLSASEFHTCLVQNGTGTVSNLSIKNIKIICNYNPPLTIGGSVSGLGSGTIVLQNNNGDNLSINSNGNFSFVSPVFTGDVYLVTILTLPLNHTCSLTNQAGTVSRSNINNISISCSPITPYPNNPAYTEAVRSTYRCETGRGNLYFEFGYGVDDLLVYYPVGKNRSSITDCTKKSLLGNGDVSGRSSCVFFAPTDPGRWSLSFSKANLITEVPSTLTKRIASNYDCEHNTLQSGVTSAECSKEYTCYKETTLAPTYLEPIDLAMSTAYQCKTPHGTAYFGLNYFSYSEGARFSPIQNSKKDCTDLSKFPKGSLIENNSAECVFYGRRSPWDFMISNFSSLKEFPNQVTTALARTYCRDTYLADGVSIAQCKDEYLCNKIDLNKFYPTPVVDESNFPDIVDSDQAFSDVINSTYSCNTEKGKTYFEFAYAAGKFTVFYPLGNSGNNTKSCSDTSLIGRSEVSGRQSCLFYGETGSGPSSRWSLSLGDFISKTKFPNSVVGKIATNYDCQNNLLQSSVTMNECSAAYKCDIQKNTKANHIPIAKQIYKTGYKCGTPKGDVYFSFHYMNNETVSFRPVGSSSYSKTECLDRNRLSRNNPAKIGSQKCVFFETNSGKYNLSIENISNLSSLPNTITAPIAESFYCNRAGSLQAGVTKEMCNAEYTCNKIDL